MVNKNQLKTTGIIIGMFVVIFIIMIWTRNSRIEAELRPYLKTEKMVEGIRQNPNLLLRMNGLGAVPVPESECLPLLKDSFDRWEVSKEKNKNAFKVDMTLYISIADDYKICFSKLEPETAVVQFREEVCYYKIPKDLYEKLSFSYMIRSYMIPEELIAPVVDGKLTNLESLNETPVNKAYHTIQVGNETYYIYKDKAKYYVESPYLFIKEISQEAYEDMLPHAQK
jgi:hypothetical protein